MHFNDKIKLTIGFLIILSTITSYILSVNEIKKIPLNYELISEHEGQDRVLENIGGNSSDPFLIREILRQNIVNVNGDILEVKATVVGIDSATNDIIFDNAVNHRCRQFLGQIRDFRS